MVIDEHTGRLVYRAEPLSLQRDAVRRSTSENLFERGDEQGTSDTPTTRSRTRSGPPRSATTVRAGEGGQVYLTTVSGQSRTVTPHDYRMTDTPPTTDEEATDPDL